MSICIKLKHPNLVAFDQQGYTKGMFYFTMEYCPGGSLQNLLDRKIVLNPDEAVPIMLQVLDGLLWRR